MNHDRLFTHVGIILLHTVRYIGVSCYKLKHTLCVVTCKCMGFIIGLMYGINYILF